MRRSNDVGLWIFLLVSFLALGALTANAIRIRLSLGFLGGVWQAWYAAYNGSVFYGQSWNAAATALSVVAHVLKTQGEKAAQAELDRWLNNFDPRGLVKDAIDAGQIVESLLFAPLP